MQSKAEFVDYLRKTLIPDLRESGREETAADFETAANLLTSRETTVAECIATALAAMQNCLESKNREWYSRWMDRLDVIARDVLPSGSGVDNGTTIEKESKPDCIKLYTSFQHMNDGGMYDGWTQHSINVRPIFGGISVKVFGQDRNGIKEYLGEMFHNVLTSPYSFKE